MSTSVIAAIFATLLIIGGFLLFGGSADAPTTHTMPDGSTMSDTDQSMDIMPQGEHMMPDGSMMMNETNAGTHIMPNGSVMMDTDVRMETEAADTSAPMDHSMMGHSL
jgi:hypothetical protein